ncbi:MAG: hypothetical protein J5I65_03170 [Aridibacter famidurans]|nr:hypothetical protein [Aridibacter famidurans]
MKFRIENILDRYLRTVHRLLHSSESFREVMQRSETKEIGFAKPLVVSVSDDRYAFPDHKTIANAFRDLQPEGKLNLLDELQRVESFTMREIERILVFMPFLDAELLKTISTFEDRSSPRYTDPIFEIADLMPLSKYDYSVEIFASEFSKYVDFCKRLDDLLITPFIKGRSGTVVIPVYEMSTEISNRTNP